MEELFVDPVFQWGDSLLFYTIIVPFICVMVFLFVMAIICLILMADCEAKKGSE